MKKLTLKDLKQYQTKQGEAIYISDDILDAYLNEVKLRGQIVIYKAQILKKILRICQNKLSITGINNAINSFELINSSKNYYAANVRPFLNWLNTNLNVNLNPKLINSYENDSTKKEALTRNELKQLTDMLDVFGNIQFKIAFLLLSTNGMRLGELCSVNWNEVKGESCYIKTEKTKKIRTAWICPQVRALLNQYQFTLKYNSIQEYFRRFKTFLKRVLPSFNKNISAHVLRHTVATIASENGLPIETISRMLGHDDITTTLKVYIHSNKELEIQNFKLLQLNAVDVFNNQLLINENRLLRKLLIIHGVDLNHINNYINQNELEIKRI